MKRFIQVPVIFICLLLILYIGVPSDKFTCLINNATIPVSLVCNGQANCADRSDETPYACGKLLIKKDYGALFWAIRFIASFHFVCYVCKAWALVKVLSGKYRPKFVDCVREELDGALNEYNAWNGAQWVNQNQTETAIFQNNGTKADAVFQIPNTTKNRPKPPKNQWKPGFISKFWRAR